MMALLIKLLADLRGSGPVLGAKCHGLGEELDY